MKKFNRIFNSYDVIVLSLVNQVDYGSEGGAFATASWSGNQHNTVLQIRDLHKLFRQIKISELGWPPRNNSHDDRVTAALFEDVHAKATLAGKAKGKVS